MFKELIEQDSELVCQLLVNRKKLTIAELRELTDYQELYICLILGWLSKENRIVYLDTDDDLGILSSAFRKFSEAVFGSAARLP